MFALKILAGRDKDIADCRILLPQTRIRTRKQAQRVLDRYVLPEAQQDAAETIAYATPCAVRIRKCGGAMRPKTFHTMARAYQQICAGEDPWTALGNFKNAWYDYARDTRAALVSEPLKKPERDTEHTRHWAAFCAASVEFLCDRYGLICPAWVFDLAYTLATPWYGDTIVNLADAVVLQHRRKTTPTPFARRNVFCGNRLYQNKYELNEWLQEARSKGMNEPRDIWRYARQKESTLHSA